MEVVNDRSSRGESLRDKKQKEKKKRKPAF
jgi:hypothetical protein